MNIIFSNRYIDAFVKMVSIFGITHLVILALLAMYKNVLVLNAFNILDLDAFIPALGEGVINFVLSYCVVGLVYCISFLFLTKPVNIDNRSSIPLTSILVELKKKFTVKSSSSDTTASQ